MSGLAIAAANQGGGFSPDDYFAVLLHLIGPVAAALGKRSEVVIHDFRLPGRSIIGIAGNVTGRHVGGSVSQIGLSIMRAGDDAEAQYNYITRAPNGRVLKSTTVPLRTPDGHVFGAFCVNVDVTDLWRISNTLNEELASGQTLPEPVAFVDDVTHVLDDLIEEETRKLNCPADRLDRHERLELIASLDRRGVFMLQRSVPEVARRLGLSRASLYTYLREVRGTGDVVREDSVTEVTPEPPREMTVEDENRIEPDR